MGTVSQSEVKLFRKCQKAHDYKYRQRLKRKRKALGLWRGTILHSMLNAYYAHKMNSRYTGPDPWDTLDKYEEEYATMLSEEKEMYGDVIGDCTAIFEGYLRRWKKEDLKYEGSEEFVATDLVGDVRFQGYIDKVVKDKQGRRFLLDHKFMKAMPTAEDRFADLQLLMYVWAWNRWNSSKPVCGVIWDYGRAKAPAIPDVLKSGLLSKRKNIDTDAYTYKQAVREGGFKLEDYADIIDSLRDRETTFFQRVILPNPPKRMVEEIVEDFRITTVMIQKLEGIAPRNMSQFNCKTCEFKELCEAEMRGHDSEFVKKTKYEDRDPYRRDDRDGTEESE